MIANMSQEYNKQSGMSITQRKSACYNKGKRIPKITGRVGNESL